MQEDGIWKSQGSTQVLEAKTCKENELKVCQIILISYFKTPFILIQKKLQSGLIKHHLYFYIVQVPFQQRGLQLNVNFLRRWS